MQADDPEQELHQALVGYYGSEKVDRALRLHSKLRYENKTAPFSLLAPVRFAKLLLDRGRLLSEEAKALGASVDRVDEILTYFDGNLKTLAGYTESTLAEINFGSDRYRIRASLWREMQKKGRLDVMQQFQWYAAWTDRPWLRLIFLSALPGFVGSWWLTYTESLDAMNILVRYGVFAGIVTFSGWRVARPSASAFALWVSFIVLLNLTALVATRFLWRFLY